MNLYRSFGNLLETWVVDGYPLLDPQGQTCSEVGEEVEGVVSGGQAFRSGSRDSLLFSGNTARSESEDSGVELVSAGSPWPSQQHMMAVALEAPGAGESEGPDEVVAASGADHPPVWPSSPALSTYSCPFSPYSSCQSVGSQIAPLATNGSPSGMRAEQEPRQTDRPQRQVPKCGLSSFTSLANRGDPATLPRKRPSQRLAGGPQDCWSQRSQSFEQGGELTSCFLPQTPEVQAAGLQTDPYNRSPTQLSDRLQTQQSNAPSTPSTSRLHAQASGTRKEGWAELSPGFVYLEQVCLMLERFARLQTHHRSLQTEIDQLRNQQDHITQHSTQPSTVNQCTSLHTNDSTSQIHDRQTEVCEATLSSYGHDVLMELRPRSMSDAGRLTSYRFQRRRSKSIGDLLEEDEEETAAPGTAENQEQSERQGKPAKTLKKKIASLRKNEARPDSSAARSQTLPRLGKKASFKILGQFFKKRSKTTST